MKKLLKKNQLMITALAIMIAIAGYLQFAGNGPDTGKVASESYTTEDLLKLSESDLALQNTWDITSLDSDLEDTPVDNFLDDEFGIYEEADEAGAVPTEGEIPGEAIFTSTQGLAVLADAKLLKEQTRAKNKDILLSIINSTELTDAQKETAVTSMVEMTEIAEKESAAEILLEAKGFEGVIVSITGNEVDVVVNKAALDDIQRAQIEDIVTRKTDIQPQNIIISTVVQ